MRWASLAELSVVEVVYRVFPAFGPTSKAISCDSPEATWI